jgi:hypothetical protein
MPELLPELFESSLTSASAAAAATRSDTVPRERAHRVCRLRVRTHDDQQSK